MGDTNDPAFVAFSRMDTNVIPFLVERIRAPDSWLENLIHKANRKQDLVHIPSGETWPRDLAAAYALYAMGTNAKPALPALANMLFHTNGLPACSIPLAGMGSAGIHALIQASTNQSWPIRHLAVSDLGMARSDFHIVVATLVDRLSDPKVAVHQAALISLGQLHKEPGVVVPILTKEFGQRDLLSKKFVLIALSRFGPDARECVPMLLKALNEPDQSLKRELGFAVKEIDPEAAARAGIR